MDARRHWVFHLCSTQYLAVQVSAANKWDIDLNNQRGISYPCKIAHVLFSIQYIRFSGIPGSKSQKKLSHQ